MQKLPAVQAERLNVENKAKRSGIASAALGVSAAVGFAKSVDAQVQPPSDGALTNGLPEVGGSEAVILMSSELAQAAPAVQQILPTVPLDVASDAAAIAYAQAPIPVALPVTDVMANTQVVAQAQVPAARPATTDGSFWPEDHWGQADQGGSGLGGLLSMVGTVGGGAAGVGLIAGSGYLVWRAINTEPTFDHDVVFETFTEGLCGTTAYIAPGKDADNDTLTYTIVASTTDDSSLFYVEAGTNEIKFTDDPLVASPGDLNRDGTYSFTIQVEDEDGNTATQVVNLTIQAGAPVPFVQPFVQKGGSICGDHFTVTAASASPSLFDISGGKGNDYAHVTAAVDDIGIDLGSGNDTLHLAVGVVHDDILVDLGEDGRDTIEIDAAVSSLVVQNFDANDVIFLDGGVVTPAVGLGTTLYPGTPVEIFKSEADALTAITAANEVAAYQNGDDSFIIVGTAGTTTIKLEDYILTDYSQIII